MRKSGGKIIIAGFIAGLVAVVGCSGKKSNINACAVVNQSEVMSLSIEIKGHDYFPETGNKPQVCVWHDGSNKNLVMIFYYDSTQVEPVELVKKGMSGKDWRIVQISGVGSAAAAAFSASSEGNDSEEMKLFAAKNGKGAIGIRARNIGNENSDTFIAVKQLANTALNRIEQKNI